MCVANTTNWVCGIDERFISPKVAGPMWSAPLHDVAFVEKVLKHVEEKSDLYGTTLRMKGMLTVAKEVIRPPFSFFTKLHSWSILGASSPILLHAN